MNVPSRRRFLRGMAGILATGMAPAIITTPGLLMPVRVEPVLIFNEEMLTVIEKSFGEVTERWLYVVKSLDGLPADLRPIALSRLDKWKPLDDGSRLLVRA